MPKDNLRGSITILHGGLDRSQIIYFVTPLIHRPEQSSSLVVN